MKGITNLIVAGFFVLTTNKKKQVWPQNKNRSSFTLDIAPQMQAVVQ